RNTAGAAPWHNPIILRLFRGTGRFGPMSASAPPYVGRLHGVLAVLPSTRIASVAHVELGQSFPRPPVVSPIRQRWPAHQEVSRVPFRRPEPCPHGRRPCHRPAAPRSSPVHRP